jgi:hypothetical protein
MTIPVISMHKPWCYFVALGFKTIETRTHQRFASLVGKRIGIHAAKHFDDKWEALAAPYVTEDFINQVRAWGPDVCPEGIICTVQVMAHCLLSSWADSARAMIDCRHTTRYGLVLTNPLTLSKPIPCKGRQGIFYPKEVDL